MSQQQNTSMLLLRPTKSKESVWIEEVVTPKGEFLRILKQHFRGAKEQTTTDDESAWNYVHDPQFIRKQNYSFQLTDDSDYVNACAPPGKGPEHPDGYRVLSSKVKVSPTTERHNNIKVFCAIYTYDGAKELLRAIAETWGKRCDGFMGASNVTDPYSGVANLHHQGVSGRYNSIWQKIRSMLVYIYQHYLDDYDYYHIMGDDVFLIVENLKVYLAELPKDVFVYAGAWTRPFWKTYLPQDFYYAGGGPGYTLSRSVVTAFVERILFACEADSVVSEEDLFMGWCMRSILRTRVMDTIDLEHHEHRYHGLDADNTHNGYTLSGFLAPQMRWQAKTFPQTHSPVKDGMESVSAYSIAFHQIKSAAKMRRYEKILYRKEIKDCVCNKGDDEREPGYPVTQSIEGGRRQWCEWDYSIGPPHDLSLCENWTSIKETILVAGCDYKHSKGT